MELSDLLQLKKEPAAAVILGSEAACILLRLMFASGVKGVAVKKNYNGVLGELYIHIWHGLFNGVPILYALSPVLDWADYNTGISKDILAVAGGVVSALGVYIFYASHADLGKSWSSTLKVRPGQKLVTRGVYSIVRHPMYVSGWVLGLGKLIVCSNWVCAAIVTLTNFAHLFARIPSEEKMMLREFGDEYKKYMSRVGGLFPKIW